MLRNAKLGVWATDLTDLFELGVEIRLYFKLLQHSMVTFFIMSLVVLPLCVAYASNELAYMTPANLGISKKSQFQGRTPAKNWLHKICEFLGNRWYQPVQVKTSSNRKDGAIYGVVETLAEYRSLKQYLRRSYD